MSLLGSHYPQTNLKKLYTYYTSNPMAIDDTKLQERENSF
jgi:hypothetical protein